MGKINVLGFDIANLIAAGEVVDRPASVVKELMENAIDSGAKNITVEIRSGGTKLIRVSDDGCGISSEDLPLSVLRHATSKISSVEDLAEIMTLGFRGEALAAISSVTKLKILSKTADAEFGSQLIVNCGEIVELSETGCADGTTVIAEELFCNVPARRKFLKKDSTETAAVTGVVEKIALSSPGISIRYIVDGETRFHTQGNSDMLGVIYVIYGRDISNRIKHIHREENGIIVDGYISEPDFFRPNRNMQNFFINHRYVKSRTMAAAVEQAYATRIPSDKFPFCIIELTINPEAVDVNVHPSKLEVKFTNERIIFESVYYAVLSGLESTGSIPEFKLPNKNDIPKSTAVNSERNKSFWVSGNQARELMNTFLPAEDKKGEQMSVQNIKTESAAFSTPRPPVNEVPKKPHIDPSPAEIRPVSNETTPECDSLIEPDFQNIGEKSDIVETSTEPASAPSQAEHDSDCRSPALSVEVSCADLVEEATEENIVPDYVIIGEVYNCYIVVQIEDRLIFIDKHAAHERIIFDSLREKMKNKEKHSQILMFPIEVSLTENELDALREFEEKINDIGFDFTLGEKSIEITAIPEEISREACSDMIVALASSLADSVGTIESVGSEYFDARLYQASCKAAIKGGRIYSAENLRWICDRILRTPNENESAIKTCPHGRPVAFELKRNSIERQFQRLV